MPSRDDELDRCVAVASEVPNASRVDAEVPTAPSERLAAIRGPPIGDGSISAALSLEPSQTQMRHPRVKVGERRIVDFAEVRATAAGLGPRAHVTLRAVTLRGGTLGLIAVRAKNLNHRLDMRRRDFGKLPR